VGEVDLSRLFSELIRFETELWEAVDTRMRADHDLPLSRFEPMQIIGRRRPCRVNDIAEELRITVGGTSKLVDRIEASGFCERRPNPDDRRSSIITLTRRGKRVLAAATKTFEAELTSQIGGTLLPAELEQLVDTLTRLQAGLNIDRTDERNNQP
jgi:DNA-binding MarR family transcriptional regulator